MGGMNPKKMQGMMKQLGINQTEIEASKVIIEKKDGSTIIINNPEIAKITMQGQEMFQISGGEISEQSAKVEISEQDIEAVIEKTNCSKEQAKKALEETGDLAEAILKLSK